MKHSLAGKALTRYAAGLLAAGLLIFLPAGTLKFPRGWLFLGVLFLPMLVMGLVMLKKAPDLLRRRLESEEQEQTQRLVVALSALMFLAPGGRQVRRVRGRLLRSFSSATGCTPR